MYGLREREGEREGGREGGKEEQLKTRNRKWGEEGVQHSLTTKIWQFVAYFGDSIRTFPSHRCPYSMWTMTSCAIETKQCSLHIS